MDLTTSDVFAEPMIDSEEYLKEYLEQLVELGKQGQLPDLKRNMNYKVYSIQGGGFGAHKSVVFTTDDEHFVTVELGFISVNSKKHIYPVSRALDKSMKSKMEYLGKIYTSGDQLISKAVAVMKHFGNYFKFCNNCQDFCNRYVESIGLKDAQTLTTGDKTAIASIVAIILVLLYAIMKN